MQVIPITGEMTDAERQYADLLNRMAQPGQSAEKMDAFTELRQMSAEDRTALLAFADAQNGRPEIQARIKINRVLNAISDVLSEFSNAATDLGPRLAMADQVMSMPDVSSNIVQTPNQVRQMNKGR